MKKAIALRADGKADEALELAESVFKQDPKNLQAIAMLLDLHVQAGRRAEAMAVAQAAIKANPDNNQLKQIPDRDVVHKLFSEIGPRFAERNGGYTRILKLGQRPGDGARMHNCTAPDWGMVAQTRRKNLPSLRRSRSSFRKSSSFAG